MNIVAVIPARLEATRFPNKPLKKILGIPMVAHCFYRAKLVEIIDEVYIATCNREIYDFANTINGNPIMTSISHNRATTRTYEALIEIEKRRGRRADIVLMVQGDEPLIQPSTITRALEQFKDKNVDVVNIMSRFRSHAEFIDKNNVKVVVNKNNNAIYFSREPIPSPWKMDKNIPMYMQTGIIAFRREALIAFNELPETELEKIESIDMNRVIENGGQIRMYATEQFTLGVDTPEELQIAESILKNDATTLLYK